MAKALSVDLRDRVVAAVEGGLSRRKAAERFGVSISSAIRWTTLSRSTGTVRPRPTGGDKCSGRVEACAPVILQAVEARPDTTLVEPEAGVPAPRPWLPSLHAWVDLRRSAFGRKVGMVDGRSANQVAYLFGAISLRQLLQ